MAWIDYQNSFDSVPNSWVEMSIEFVGINRIFVSLLKHLWRNGIRTLKKKKEVMQSQPIQIGKEYSRGTLLRHYTFDLS